MCPIGLQNVFLSVAQSRFLRRPGSFFGTCPKSRIFLWWKGMLPLPCWRQHPNCSDWFPLARLPTRPSMDGRRLYSVAK